MKALPWLAELFKRLGERTGRGAAAIGWRIAAWTLQKGPPKARIGRLAAAAVILWAAARILPHQRLTAVLIAVFLIVSYRQGTDGPTKAAPDPKTSPEADHELAVEQARAAMLPRLRALIGDGTGVHLDTIRRLLIAEGELPDDYELSRLRRKFDAVGIPVRDSVKVSGITRIGVHRDDLPNHSPARSDRTPIEGRSAGHTTTTPVNYPADYRRTTAMLARLIARIAPPTYCPVCGWWTSGCGH